MSTELKQPSSGVSVWSYALFAFSLIACIVWIPFHHYGAALPLAARTILPGLAICGAAFLLSWGAEAAQFDIPQSLAIAFIALVAVIPEYAVDMYFAWEAGKDPTYTQYATANMTGANRLLIGFGWAVILLFYWFRSRKTFIVIDVKHRVEMMGLLLATLYSFVIPIKGTLTLIDTAVLGLIFIWYLRAAIRQHIVEPELEGGIVEVLAKLTPWMRRLSVAGLFIVSGWAIFVSAEPFAEGLLESGAVLGIEKFLLVQWLAPLASESPEFIVAIIFAWRLKPQVGLGTLISSKVNQWTLLISMLPIAYCISGGKIHAMVFDARQVEEVFLTAAQSFFALVVIMDLKFSWKEALILFVLFATQMFFPNTAVRYAYGAVYLILAALILVWSKLVRHGFQHTLRFMWKMPHDEIITGHKERFN